MSATFDLQQINGAALPLAREQIKSVNWRTAPDGSFTVVDITDTDGQGHTFNISLEEGVRFNDWLTATAPPTVAPDGSNAPDVGNAVRLLVDTCHGAAYTAGWWVHRPTGLDLKAILNSPKDDLQSLLAGLLYTNKLCLIHSEVSESMEGDRKNLPDDKLPQYPMAAVELADALIRICDLAGARNYPLGEIVAAKLAYNAQRADHKPAARLAEGGKAY